MENCHTNILDVIKCDKNNFRFQQNYQIMSFFLESKRNTDFPTKSTPSPFQYAINPQKKKQSGYAPFSSTTKLNRSVTKPQKNDKINDYEQERAFVIEDSNIQIMAQQKMNSMFKSRSQRIMQSFNNVPGPGSYELRSKYQKQKPRVSHTNKNMSATERKINPPSIPTDSLGFKCTQENKVQKVKPKPVNPPVPGSYELREQLIKQRGLSWNVNPTISRKQDDAVPPGPGAYASQAALEKAKAPTSCFVSQYDRFNPKKIKKSLNPGPGQYEVVENRPLRQFSETHFNSKSVRFPADRQANIGPGSYTNTNKSLKTFNKKVLEGYKEDAQANRKTIFNFTNKNPGPGQYIARDGMTFQLQKALLRKHNYSQFPNSRREVFEPKQFDQPGPGAYEPVIPKNNSKGNIGYKKVDVINLKDEADNEQTPSPLDYTYNNFSMSKKVQQSTKRLTLTDKKPFNVGTERFQHYSNSATKFKDSTTRRNQTYDTENNQSADMGEQTSINFQGPKKVKKLIMTSVKVKVPFGTSTSKFDQPQLTEVGPGHYDSGNNWIKQSYSIKSKLANKK